MSLKLDRISSNPARMNDQPCIRNLRLTVRRTIELLATYPNSYIQLCTPERADSKLEVAKF
jgi:hypothetical protein